MQAKTPAARPGSSPSSRGHLSSVIVIRCDKTDASAMTGDGSVATGFGAFDFRIRHVLAQAQQTFSPAACEMVLKADVGAHEHCLVLAVRDLET